MSEPLGQEDRKLYSLHVTLYYEDEGDRAHDKGVIESVNQAPIAKYSTATVSEKELFDFLEEMADNADAWEAELDDGRKIRKVR